MFNDYFIAAANELTEQIRQLNPAAADCIDHLRAEYGVRAAYFAAYALVIDPEPFIQSGRPPADKDFRHITDYEILRKIPKFIQLYEAAVAQLLTRATNGDDLVRH